MTNSQMHHLCGLSIDEVNERKQKGLVNLSQDVHTKSIPLIVASHVCTVFNGINIFLAIIVLIVGEPKNLLFAIVAVLNTVIGIVQELKSKLTVDKLSILNQKKIRVIRQHLETEVDSEELVKDDLVILSHGEQIPADAIVEEGEISVDEGILTGEAAPVIKRKGDSLLSGSVVNYGSCVCRLTKVGEMSYASGINSQAKFLKKISSEILTTLKKIVTVAVVVLIPLGLGLFFRTYYMQNTSFNDAALTSAAAVIGMVPQGLVLLTSSVLALATIRLGSRQVLIQQLYCVETLARVDTLCLDKTGTITTAELTLLDCEAKDGFSKDDVLTAAASVCFSHLDDANDTDRAIIAYAKDHAIKAKETLRSIPFSSEKKYSGCVCADTTSYVMGAAEFFLQKEDFCVLQNLLQTADQTSRILTVAMCDGFDETGRVVGGIILMGCVVFTDQIRQNASSTIRDFVQRGVGVKIISGDDPMTVSAIAAKVGVPHADRYIDARELSTEQEIYDAVQTYAVFGRVTPEQKRDMVSALKQNGHTVAMTGDGVNDILALKEADCAVSFASASACAKNIAEVILCDNDFSHMVEVVGEGRRSINNLERSAALFLVKSVYTALLALICIIVPPYPFIPIQMTLISAAVIGIPSFVLALEPNHDMVTGHFLKNVLCRSLPASGAVTIGLCLAIIYARSTAALFGSTSFMCMTIVAVVGVALIYKLSLPLTMLRKILLLVIIAILVLAITLFGSFFEITILDFVSALICLVLSAISLGLFLLFYRMARDKFCM